jgi:hypothetical protein
MQPFKLDPDSCKPNAYTATKIQFSIDVDREVEGWLPNVILVLVLFTVDVNFGSYFNEKL